LDLPYFLSQVHENAMLCKPELDAIDLTLIRALQRNGREPFATLARQVELSAPAVAERVRRLEELGVITGYRAVIDPKALGLDVTALIRVAVNGDRCASFGSTLCEWPEVVQAWRLTGTESYMLVAHVASVEHLERMLNEIVLYGTSITSIVLSSPQLSGEILPPLRHPRAARPLAEKHVAAVAKAMR
jgi:Lrp/AsnC family leucine-responsive transcriptional regulator